jgi:hypothetical protein
MDIFEGARYRSESQSTTEAIPLAATSLGARGPLSLPDNNLMAA